MVRPHGGQKPRSLVVLFHGYGAGAKDLVPLAEAWRQVFPETAFVSLQAPYHMGHEGQRMWFSLEDWDPVRIFPLLKPLADWVAETLGPLMKEIEVYWSNTAFVGFSQGGMLALAQGLLFFNVSGVLCYSGLFLPSPHGTPVKGAAKVCLVHGAQDDVVPVQYFYDSQTLLKRLNVPFESYLFQGLGHTIDRRCLEKGAMFLKNALIGASAPNVAKKEKHHGS